MAIRVYTPEKEYFHFGARMEYLCEHLKGSAGKVDVAEGVRTESNGKSATVGLCSPCAERLGKGESLDWPRQPVLATPLFKDVLKR